MIGWGTKVCGKRRCTTSYQSTQFPPPVGTLKSTPVFTSPAESVNVVLVPAGACARRARTGPTWMRLLAGPDELEREAAVVGRRGGRVVVTVLQPVARAGADLAARDRLALGVGHSAAHRGRSGELQVDVLLLLTGLRSERRKHAVGPGPPLAVLAVVGDEVVIPLAAGRQEGRESAVAIGLDAEPRVAGQRVAGARQRRVPPWRRPRACRRGRAPGP